LSFLDLRLNEQEGLPFLGVFPVATRERWVPRKARARIQGLNLSGVAAGPLIATPLTIWIMTAFGWNAMFYFYGILGFLWIVAPGVTGYVAMWFGWTAALGLGSVLALLSAIIMYLTAPKPTSKQHRV